MNAIEDERLCEVETQRENMRQMLAEAELIERECFNLPFFKRIEALNELEILRAEIKELAQNIARLESE